MCRERIEVLTKQRATLNISERDMSSERYSKIITQLYENSEGWLGFNKSLICWFNDDETKKHISFSAEVHGLIFDVLMKEDEWQIWLNDFMREATEKFGFEVLNYDA